MAGKGERRETTKRGTTTATDEEVRCVKGWRAEEMRGTVGVRMFQQRIDDCELNNATPDDIVLQSEDDGCGDTVTASSVDLHADSECGDALMCERRALIAIEWWRAVAACT